MKTKTPTKSRAKTSKRFVLRVNVSAVEPVTRGEVREWVQQWLDHAVKENWFELFKAARVTNADIP